MAFSEVFFLNVFDSIPTRVEVSNKGFDCHQRAKRKHKAFECVSIAAMTRSKTRGNEA